MYNHSEILSFGILSLLLELIEKIFYIDFNNIIIVLGGLLYLYLYNASNLSEWAFF